VSLSVGKLAKKYGLSRSTLLYYDSIGLLTPTGHSKGEYRIYEIDDEQRLEHICRYRKAGIPLKEVKKILESPDTSFTTVLKERFEDLNHEIRHLHEQQRIIAGLLKNSEMLKITGAMTRELWTSLLEDAGFSEQDMRQWHIRFERMDPEKHRIFLQHLQIPNDEIEIICKWAKE
jgi:DNA-binding transcriptional MerR regulator